MTLSAHPRAVEARNRRARAAIAAGRAPGVPGRPQLYAEGWYRHRHNARIYWHNERKAERGVFRQRPLFPETDVPRIMWAPPPAPPQRRDLFGFRELRAKRDTMAWAALTRRVSDSPPDPLCSRTYEGLPLWLDSDSLGTGLGARPDRRRRPAPPRLELRLPPQTAQTETDGSMLTTPAPDRITAPASTPETDREGRMAPRPRFAQLMAQAGLDFAAIGVDVPEGVTLPLVPELADVPTPAPAQPAQTVTCSAYSEHQLAHRRGPDGWTCTVCEPVTW